MYLETLTIKDTIFCLHHIVPILCESPTFDAMTRQLKEKKLVNNTRAAIGSGMECPMYSKAAKAAAVMKDVELEMDLHGDKSSIKVSDESWMYVYE